MESFFSLMTSCCAQLWARCVSRDDAGSSDGVPTWNGHEGQTYIPAFFLYNIIFS